MLIVFNHNIMFLDVVLCSYCVGWLVTGDVLPVKRSGNVDRMVMFVINLINHI